MRRCQQRLVLGHDCYILSTAPLPGACGTGYTVTTHTKATYVTLVNYVAWTLATHR
jgi:hypothetical protein